MKLYTDKSQTAKLIELGFEKPRYATMFGEIIKEVTKINYTIGELIEMLPTIIETGDGYALSIYHNRAEWMVSYDDMGFFLPYIQPKKTNSSMRYTI